MHNQIYWLFAVIHLVLVYWKSTSDSTWVLRRRRIRTVVKMNMWCWVYSHMLLPLQTNTIKVLMKTPVVISSFSVKQKDLISGYDWLWRLLRGDNDQYIAKKAKNFSFIRHNVQCDSKKFYQENLMVPMSLNQVRQCQPGYNASLGVLLPHQSKYQAYIIAGLHCVMLAFHTTCENLMTSTASTSIDPPWNDDKDLFFTMPHLSCIEY